MDIAATAQDRDSLDATDDESNEAAASSGAKLYVNGSDTGGEDENKFQRAVAVWRNIGLTKLIPSLDGIASEIVAGQRDSLVQRKDLAQKTKGFRKLDDPSKLVEIKSLLKAYQSFIDLLTNQSKTSQSAFLQLYSTLSEAPDPFPLLEASVDSLVISEETLPMVTAENQQLQRSVSRLAAQLDETEKRLDAEREARRSLETSWEGDAKEIEQSWSAVMQEKQENWEAKERSLEERLENQDRLLKELKASYEVSQRLGQGDTSAYQDAVSGSTSAAEFEMLNADLERTSLRLAEVEARNEQLRTELAQRASHREAKEPASNIEDDPAFLRLQSENSALLRKLDAARLQKDTETRVTQDSLRKVQRDLSTLKEDRDILLGKVQKCSDYEEVKRELEVLKSIEFATGDDFIAQDDNELELASSRGPNGAMAKDTIQTLEQMLLARNKKLNGELAILRVSHLELQNRLETLQNELSNTNMELEKSRNLTATLENDLVQVQEEAANALPSSAMSVAGTYTSRYPSSTYPGRRGRASPTSSIISGFDPHYNSSEAIRAVDTVGGGSGILPMLTAQRDRFKKRNADLEAELAKTYQTVSSLRSEIASLQKDNLNLYEKTRYISSYNRSPASPGSSYVSNTLPSILAMSSDHPEPSFDRYRSNYESSISPFQEFRGRESARALNRMLFFDRAVYRITRFILASRIRRNLFALYCLTLHILILKDLYGRQGTSVEQH